MPKAPVIEPNSVIISEFSDESFLSEDCGFELSVEGIYETSVGTLLLFEFLANYF